MQNILHPLIQPKELKNYENPKAYSLRYHFLKSLKLPSKYLFVNKQYECIGASSRFTDFVSINGKSGPFNCLFLLFNRVT